MVKGATMSCEGASARLPDQGDPGRVGGALQDVGEPVVAPYVGDALPGVELQQQVAHRMVAEWAGRVGGVLDPGGPAAHLVHRPVEGLGQHPLLRREDSALVARIVVDGSVPAEDPLAGEVPVDVAGCQVVRDPYEPSGVEGGADRAA